MNSERGTPVATLLPDGQVLATGGVGPGGLFAELYNPATGTWTATSGAAVCSPVQICHPGSTATLLGTGNVLVTGGYGGAATRRLPVHQLGGLALRPGHQRVDQDRQYEHGPGG